jgi:hypothetical protein
VIDELADHAGVLIDFVAESLGTLREPETEIIRCDATEAVAQRDDDVAVQEAPRRVAVAEQDRRPVSLVDVMDAAARAVESARLERVQLRVRSENDAHCPSSDGPHDDIPEV